ncbi:hypothetical protein CASFOL_032142 [Castilleja foliolosa]|uniref:ZF-HD dimerization-type domain-containing protein n=1 Tax=Castilleja foliolosa TaxID=1961234 RepID=A0ABD3C1S5_9LAMI
MGQERASHGECLKAHAHMGGKVDGCQEFKPWPSSNDGEECSICSCHRNYHKKLAQVVYMECHKNHYVNGSHVKDGCKEYRENQWSPNKCDACGCDKSFHRNELIIRRLENRVLTEVQGRGSEKHPKDESVAAVASNWVAKEKQKEEYNRKLAGDDEDVEDDD